MKALIMVILGLVAALLVIALISVMASWEHDTWEAIFAGIFWVVVLGGLGLWVFTKIVD